MAEDGLYVSTAGEYFHDKDSLQEHYRSAFHRYNLKRKIAGLPPVTREWYDARKAQLAAAAATPAARIWTDPLTRKRFGSENTYLAYVRSNRYKELVKKSGQPAPEPVVSIARRKDEGAEEGAPEQGQGQGTTTSQGFVSKGGLRAYEEAAKRASAAAAEVQARRERGEPSSDEEEGLDEEGSDWETASEEDDQGEVAAASQGASMEAEEEEEAVDDDEAADLALRSWMPERSLFDSREFETVEECLRYMHATYGFYLPDAEYLSDPEGLLRYLHAKLAVGHIPLHASGLDPNSKRFRSLHAVRRHMIDTCSCKILYDGNEEEYEDYYDYGGADAEEEEEEGGEEGSERQLAIAGAPAQRGLAVVDPASLAEAAASSYELVLARPGGGTRVLGTREFARYYRQNHRAGQIHEGVAAARVVAEYRRLAIACAPSKEVVEKRRAERGARKERARWLGVSFRRNINDNLPKNVPY